MLKYLRLGSKRIKVIWWVLIVVTVVTFVGGFIFLFGSGLDSGTQAQISGALGTVNGQPISRADYQNAITEQRLQYRQRFQSDPGEQETRLIEAQAWRSLVTQQLLSQQAHKLGLRSTDKEVVITLQSSPPQALLAMPDFQTNGQFDPELYKRLLAFNKLTPAQFEAEYSGRLLGDKAMTVIIDAVALTPAELAEAKTLMARPSSSEPVAGLSTNDRILQDMLFQKQQRALMAFKEAMRAKVQVTIRKEML